MRLAAQMRGGFYPAHEEAMAHAASFLRPPEKGPFAILDPCAGEGAAIQQLGRLLGCPSERIFAIELDDSRAEKARTALPECQVLAPANFFGCRATSNSFSFLWLNPPFDHSYAGNRVEEQFLQRATDWLMPGGVLAFVCPKDVIDEYSEARRHFTIFYEKYTITAFPEEHRPFKEVVVFGHKRAKPTVDESGSYWRAWESARAPENFCYHIPSGNGPKVFQKLEPTESELQRMVTKSPLRSFLDVPPTAPVLSPPLALGMGHVALLLASGHLDGVVHANDCCPQVVRGTARKSAFIADVSDSVNADGSVTTRTTVSERIDLVVRTVDLTGTIRTFLDTDVTEAQA